MDLLTAIRRYIDGKIDRRKIAYINFHSPKQVAVNLQVYTLLYNIPEIKKIIQKL